MALDPLEHVVDHPLIKGLPVTKFQALLVLSATLIAVIYIGLARRIRDGQAPRGGFWNFFEGILLYLRDEVARPNIGEHDADRFLPFIWTVFLFILFNNLFGLVPYMGSATADISVTLVLATFAFLIIHGSAVMKLGVGRYLKSFVPHLEADNLPMKLFLTLLIVPMITVIEVLGALVRGAVLAIRLFANIFAGHVALAVILLFAVKAAESSWATFGTISVMTVLMGTALSVLELFIAFLQAFVFTLLTAIFLGMQLHPEH